MPNNVKEEKMKIILIRHGESIDDTLDCYGGAADFALSEPGIHADQEVAQSLSKITVDKIYSSPLKRAKQTAEAIDAVKKCGITTIPDLRERNSYGVLSGCNREMSKDIFGYLLDSFKGKPGDYYSDELVLGAEPRLEFDKRIKDALNSLASDASKNGHNTVVVVTHGNVTRSIYQNILNYGKKIHLDLLAKTIIEYDNCTFSLISKESVHDK